MKVSMPCRHPQWYDEECGDCRQARLATNQYAAGAGWSAALARIYAAVMDNDSAADQLEVIYSILVSNGFDVP